MTPPYALPPQLLKVTVVSGDFMLRLQYQDLGWRQFDCRPYLDRGIFAALRDPSRFQQVFLSHGTVCWPGGLDLAPETVFERSQPSEAPPDTAVSTASAA
jgi:Protein of unknown function (DUF2442)